MIKKHAFKICMALSVVLPLALFPLRFSRGSAETFNASVYAAVFTLAAITGTLITIVSGTLNKKIYGIPVSVYLHLSAYHFNPLYLILLSVFIVGGSTLTYYFGRAYATVAYLVLELIYIGVFSAKMWQMVVDDGECVRLLKKETEQGEKNKKTDWKYIVGCLFAYYESELVNTASAEGDRADNCSKLLSPFLRNFGYYPEQRADIQRLSTDISKRLLSWDNLNRLGLKSLSSFWKLLKEKDLVDEPSLIRSCAQALRYMGDEEIYAINFRKRFYEAVSEETFDEFDKETFLYCSVKSLSENARMTPAAKEAALAACIRTLFADPLHGFEAQQTRLCAFLFQSLVLENADWTGGALPIFKQMLLALNVQNYFFPKKTRASVIAYLYLLQYTYGYCERQISQKRRDAILSLGAETFTDPVDGYAFSFFGLLQKNIGDVLVQIREICDAAKDSEFDYWGKLDRAKWVVWEKSHLRKVLYFTYFPNYYCYNGLIYRSNDWERLPPEEKRAVLVGFLELFDPSDSGLTPKTVDEVCALSSWAGFRSTVDRMEFAELFERANEEMKQFTPIGAGSNDCAIEEYDQGDDPMYCRDGEALPESVTQRLECGVHDKHIFTKGSLISFAYDTFAKHLLDRVIEQKFVPLELTFDGAGVEKLLDLIEREDIQGTNYLFTNDLMLSAEVRKSESFSKLEARLRKIHDPKIACSERIFFGKVCPRYQYILKEVTMAPVTEEEIERTCEENKIAEDRYSVQDGCVLNLSEAKDYVRKNYTHDALVLELRHNFSSCKCYRVTLHWQ